MAGRREGERDIDPGKGVDPAAESVERFRPTNGRLTGVLGLLMVAGALALVVVEADAGTLLWFVPGALLAAAVIWAFLLRPAVSVEGEELVLRGPVSTTYVPLAAIEEVGMGQVLAVRAGGRRYVSGAVGRSRREAGRDDRVEPGAAAGLSYGGYVEERLRGLVADAMLLAHVKRHSPEQAALAEGVRRTWAWPEIGAIVALVLMLVVIGVV